jgi:Kef-type K+ transport system membrane component KefB
MVDAALFVFDLSIFLVATIAGGILAKKLGYPVALGELLVGVVLGPSLFNIGMDQSIVSVFSELGAIILLFYIGLETEVSDLKRQFKPSLYVGIFGAIAPLILCFIGALFLGISINEAMFLGVVFTATSIGFTVRLLSDVGKLHTPTGLTILGAGIVDDVLAIVLLSIVLSIISGGIDILGIGVVIVKAILFWTAMLYFGMNFLNKFLERVRMDNEYTILFLLAYGLLSAYLSTLIGLSAIVGAFAAGLPLSKMNLKVYMFLKETKTLYMFFVPIFFISIGTMINVNAFMESISAGILITILALAGKFIGCFIASHLNKFSVDESIKIGFGMMPRGEMGLIVASLGLTSSLISSQTYSIAVMAVTLTTFISLPLLKIILGQNKKAIPRNSVL